MRTLNSRVNAREAVFNYIAACGLNGATTEEVAIYFNTTPNVVSGRLSDLKKEGRLLDTGLWRYTRNHAKAHVFITAGKPLQKIFTNISSRKCKIKVSSRRQLVQQ